MQTTTAPEPSRSFYRRLATHAGLPFATLDPAHREDPDFLEINPLAARLLSEQICRYHRMLPVSYANGVVTIATPEPFDQVAREVATALTGRSVRFVVSPEEDVDRAIDETFDAMPLDEPGRVTEPSYPTRIGDLLVAPRARHRRAGARGARGAGAHRQPRRRHPGARGHRPRARARRHPRRAVPAAARRPLRVRPGPGGARAHPRAAGPPPARRPDRGRRHDTLYLAIADVLDDDTCRRAARAHRTSSCAASWPRATRSTSCCSACTATEYVTVARSELLNRFPEESANRVLSGAPEGLLPRDRADLPAVPDPGAQARR